MTIISTEKCVTGTHSLEDHPWMTTPPDGFIAVPDHLRDKAWDSLGYCDLVLDADGNLIDITPTDKPETPPEELDAQYKALVVRYIRERYSDNDEFAMTALAVSAIENGAELPGEYTDYRAYVEDCKARARTEVYGE